MGQNDRIRQSSGVLFNQVDDDLVMMDVEKGSYFGVNAVGAAIWNMIAEPIRIQDVIRQLLEQYDVTEEVCRQETLAFLEQAHEKGFIQLLDD